SGWHREPRAPRFPEHESTPERIAGSQHLRKRSTARTPQRQSADSNWRDNRRLLNQTMAASSLSGLRCFADIFCPDRWRSCSDRPPPARSLHRVSVDPVPTTPGENRDLTSTVLLL